MMTGQPAYGFRQSMMLEMPADLAGAECGAKKQHMCFAGKMRDAKSRSTEPGRTVCRKNMRMLSQGRV